MKSISIIVFTFCALISASCANRPCRDPQTEAGKSPSTTITESAVTTTTLTSTKIFIAKPDGSKQCKGKGIDEKTMQKELKGISVFSSKKDHDGLMRIQVCGADTGRFNIYEIDTKDLEKAKSLGFSEWKK